MKPIVKPYVALLLIALVWVSCKKPDEPPIDCTPPPSNSGTLKINFNATYNGVPLVLFTDYTTVENHRIRPEELRFLVSDMWSEDSLGDSIYIKDAFKYDLAAGVISATIAMSPGNYNGLGFSLGVNAVKNHANPAIYPLGHPLAVGPMHWDWANGYIFTMYGGKVDTSGTGTGPLNITYGFHAGADTLFSPLPLFPHAYSIALGSTTEINVDVNVAKFLSNVSDTIDLRYDNVTHTFSNLPLAIRFMNLYKLAFSIP
ncbi:MAG: MbnP family protein [Flavobacteriales bacterium]